MARISTVIVTFNSAAHIAQCLLAVRSGNVDVEIIVIDNCSEDRTARLVQKLLANVPSARFRQMPQNVGFARAVNEGMRMATGDYIVVLNPDCFVTPSTLGDMLAVLQGDEHIGIAGCLLRNENGSEQAGCRRYIPTPWRSLMRVLHLDQLPLVRSRRRFSSFVMSREPLPGAPMDVEALSGALMMVRRPATDDVGLLDERYFMHCEDLDWCMRFKEHGWRVVFIPTTHAVHAKGGSSRSRPLRVEYHKHRGMVRFYQTHFSRRYPFPLMLLVFLSVWFRFFLKMLIILPQSLSARRRKKADRSAVLREGLRAD